MKLFEMLLFGPWEENGHVRTALPNQKENLLKVWRNETAHTFGIERLLRLVLLLLGYLTVGLYVRHFTGRWGKLGRKLSVDCFVLCQTTLPVALLICGLEHYRAVQVLVIYLGAATLHYSLNLLFLSDIYTAPISQKRSYIMTLLNYAEVCFDFSILYKGTDSIRHLHTYIDAIYFSFITAFTVGYGDMNPRTDTGKLLVLGQCLCSLLFITLVFARIVSGFGRNGALEKTDNFVKREPSRETVQDE